MDFTLDDTQTEIAALTAKVLAGEDAAGRWRALAGAGLFGLALPPSLDGDGLGIAEVAQVLTEAGRAAAPIPVLTLASAVLPVATLGSADQRAALLPPVAAGESLLTAALHEPGAAFPLRPAVTATASNGGWVLSGVKTAVPYAAEAARVLTPVSLPGDTGVVLLDPRADGVTLTPSRNSAGTPECTMRLDGVVVSDTDLLDDPGDAVSVLYRFAVAGVLAIGDGLLAGALALTSKHVGEREQFGRPLATFQAVAGQIADVYVAARTVHLAVTSAVWRLAAGLDADAELDVAAYWFASQAPEALAVCHHLHGGIGVDETYPLHRYSSAVKDLSRLLGGAAHRLGKLGMRVC